jgi:hypothetical protein
MTFNLAQNRRQLGSLICYGAKAEPLQGSAVKTAPALAMKAAQLAATGDYWGAGPGSCCLLDCPVELDHISARDHFVEDR